MIKRFALAVLFLCYILLLVPYIIHSNLANAGVDIVRDTKIISTHSLPEDVRDIARFGDKCNVILLENINTGTKRVIITGKSVLFHKGDIVKIVDVIEEWYVDWHVYNFFDESFSSLVVGDVEQIECLCSNVPIISDLFCTLESNIEGILYSSFSGKVLLLVSEMVFFFAPLLLVSVGLLFKGRFCLWSVPAVLTLYSTQVFFSTIFSTLYGTIASSFSIYFGSSFFVLAFFTLLLKKFEESEGGQKRIKKLYDKIKEILE